jgi:hypothetical protein
MDLIPVPDWCVQNAYNGIMGTRSDVCEIYTSTLTISRLSNGVRTITGELMFDIYNYTYSNSDLPNWTHQLMVSAFSGWGDALGAAVHTSAKAEDSVLGPATCRILNSSFPRQPVQPFNSVRGGEANFNTTATAPGVIGYCRTTWDLAFSIPTYPDATGR